MTWACGVRQVVFERGTVLLIAVRIAVTRWQPGALRDNQGGSPLDPQERATSLRLLLSATRPGPARCCGCQVVVCVVVTAVVSQPPSWDWPYSLAIPPAPARLLDVTAGSTVAGGHRPAKRSAVAPGVAAWTIRGTYEGKASLTTSWCGSSTMISCKPQLGARADRRRVAGATVLVGDGAVQVRQRGYLGDHPRPTRVVSGVTCVL